MNETERIIVVGAGLAGARAVEGLRGNGYEGAVTLLGEEPQRPYLRPPLSKEYLRGEDEAEHLFVHPEPFYEEHRIDLRRSTVATGIDPRARTVALADGSRLEFERLLLATGARPRRLRLPGADLAGVRYLRTLADADALRAAASGAARVAVLGSGWIGSEVSASLRAMGAAVTLVGPDPAPLQRVLGPEMGQVFRDLHAEHGVELRLGRRVARLLGEGRVSGVELDDGATVACDLVVVGMGAEPRVELAAAAGLAVDDGILTDASLATSVPGIFAAGDVARAQHPFYDAALRIEHWANARHQGLAAAGAMLGRPMSYERLPYFYSDQYDLAMEYTGHAPAWDRVVVRGDVAARRFVAFWLRGDLVVAGMSVNTPKTMKAVERLIRSRRPIAPGALGDPDVELAALAPEEAPAG